MFGDEEKTGTSLWGLVIGFAAVALVAGFLLHIKNLNHRDMAADGIGKQFYTFASYEAAETLPPLRLLGPAGKEIALEDYRGKYVLVNFWATWCGPCVRELPSLQALKDGYKRPDMEIVAVSVDEPEHMDQVAAFLENNKIGPVAYYHDYKADLQTVFGFKVLPTTYLVSPEGRILYEMAGPANWSSSEIMSFLDQFR